MVFDKNQELVKVINKAPDWLFCFIANLFCLISPKEENILLLLKGNFWLLQRKDSQFLFTKSVHRIFRAEPYERYFKIASDEVVLDVGACIEDNTVPFAKRAKEVVAIEAGPENLAYLRMNVAINKLQNVHVIEKVVLVMASPVQPLVNKCFQQAKIKIFGSLPRFLEKLEKHN
jgi:hypothetical protein